MQQFVFIRNYFLVKPNLPVMKNIIILSICLLANSFISINAQGTIRYTLTEYVLEEGWDETNVERNSDHVTIGPHAHGQWITKELVVKIPDNVPRAKITKGNATADFGSHYSISHPDIQPDSQLHNRKVRELQQEQDQKSSDPSVHCELNQSGRIRSS